jgi:predicted ATPase
MLSFDQKVGKYKILSVIGAGGMGEIYLAEDITLNRQVVLKILPLSVAQNEERMRRFVLEAKSASALNHPNIITIYEIGQTDDFHFIAAEYIQGETVRECINKNSLQLYDILDISIQIATGLQAGHSVNIVHRDIKPENVMLRPDGLVKILDFGIAKLTESETALKAAAEATTIRGGTTPGMIIGTVAYMSPEQALGKEIDARSDIFSFGVLLYEMLSGRQPFTEDTLIQTLIAIVEKAPPPLSDLVRDYPIEIEKIVYKALAKNKDERFLTAGDLIASLRQLKRLLEFGDKFKGSLHPSEQKEIQTQIFNVAEKTSPVSIAANNLTENPLSIVGRETEIKEIYDLLQRQNVRLVTITGIGGTGKTTLAKEVARQMLSEFADGVFYIELASITNHDLVASTIAKALGIKETGTEPIIEILKDNLRDKKMLLVLDNFEQVTESAPIIGELISDSINLKILVTSRVRLYLRLEREYILSPLELPSDKKLSATELSEYPAIALFIERAKAAKSSFELTEENAHILAEICRKLDGLPLAIELAAVRVKILSPQAILIRLTNRLKLLTGGARDLPERQKTIRAAIAWSYDLLKEEEKNLLNRLAIFAGSFTLEGAETIVAVKGDLKVDVLDAVASLVDKSLLTQREQAEGEPRFRMLEIVREFALEKLAESGESSEIKRLHAAFYADLSEKAEPELRSAKATEWFDKLEREHDNLRCALEWTLDNQPESALRIVAAIFSFWVRRGYLSEGRKWTKQALEKTSEDKDLKLRANAFRGSGILSWMQGDLEAASPYFEESLRLSRALGNKQMISDTLIGLGNVKNQQGDLLSARNLLEESLLISREINDKSQISISLNNLGEIARMKGDYETARKYYEEAYAIAKRESFNLPLPTFAENLAGTALLMGDYQSARTFALETLKYSMEVGDKICVGGALDKFASLAVKAGEMEKAARLFGAAQSVFDAIDYHQAEVDQILNDRYINEARASIGDEAFDTAYAEGKAMQMEKAIVLACNLKHLQEH